MIKFTSTNCACYISATTGEVAGVIKDSRGKNIYAMPETEATLKARERYLTNVREQGELIVDLISFNKYWGYYRNLCRNNRD